jgi:hypothetical protein
MSVLPLTADTKPSHRHFGFNAQVRMARQPLRNGREEAFHFFQQVRNRSTIAREMP